MYREWPAALLESNQFTPTVQEPHNGIPLEVVIESSILSFGMIIFLGRIPAFDFIKFPIAIHPSEEVHFTYRV